MTNTGEQLEFYYELKRAFDELFEPHLAAIFKIGNGSYYLPDAECEMIYFAKIAMDAASPVPVPLEPRSQKGFIRMAFETPEGKVFIRSESERAVHFSQSEIKEPV